MGNLRYLVAGCMGLSIAGLLLFDIGQKGKDGWGGAHDGLYSVAILNPVTLLAFAIVFLIIYAAMDPGTGH